MLSRAGLLKLVTASLIIINGQTALAGGSRVGNGGSQSPLKSGVKIRIDQNFEVESPFPFIQKSKFDEGIKVEGPLHIQLKKTSLGIEPTPTYQKIEVLNLSKVMPELKKLKKDESIVSYLREKEWKSITTENKCINVQSFVGKTEVSYVVTWGDQEGFVLISSKNSTSQKAALKTIESTKILNRDCVWKK